MYFAARSLSFARFLLSSDKAVRVCVADSRTFQICVSGRALHAEAGFLIKPILNAVYLNPRWTVKGIIDITH